MTSMKPMTALRFIAASLQLLAKGFAIGTTGLIPGVSGGTLALVLGIYEDLVEAIRKASTPQTVKALVGRQWRELGERLSWQLLVPVGLGALIAVITMSHIMEWLLNAYPLQMSAFFFGLVAASIFVVARKVDRWDLRVAIGFILGAVAAWFLLDLKPAQTPNTLWMLFLSGAVAKCAMVLPGISGSFVLLIFGQYQYALAAVTQRNILGIAMILLGAVVGLVSFAQALSWLFKRHRNLTLAVLGGLILSSLRTLWPWIETVPTGTRLALPNALTPEVIVAILVAVVGFIVVLALGGGHTEDEVAAPRGLETLSVTASSDDIVKN
jgi:putative membrane protein